MPAEGVELTYVGTAMEDAAYSGGPAMGRASTGGVQEQSLGLSMRVAYQDGKISLEAGRFAIGLDWENLSTGAATEWAFEFAVPRVAYSIDGDFGDPSAPQLRELYLAMENSATLSAGVQAGTNFPPVKIASVPFQLGWGVLHKSGDILHIRGRGERKSQLCRRRGSRDAVCWREDAEYQQIWV